jgi:cyanate lyase
MAGPDSTTPENAPKGLGASLASNFSPEAIAKVVLTLDSAASQMLHQFGQGQAMADILRSSMAEAVTSVRKLGGDISDVLETQKQAAEALGRNVILSDKTSEDLYATMKVTGQSVKEIVAGMADAGISSINATNEMLKVVNIARESGVSAVAVSGKVLSNMDALNKFNFSNGVEGLAKMAAQAISLRVDMNKTLELADKLFDPDKAIEMAASMQRLGVSQSSLLDPLKLMDLAQNDPAELQNQIAEMSKQFVQLGKDGHFEIMPGAKRQLREISQAMGMSYDDITKMALGSADLDKKMKEISFPDVTEDQKKLIANMAQMGEGGEYVVKTPEGEKKVSELSKEDVAALEKMANTAPKSMEDLAKEQLSATQDVTAAINSLGDRTGLGLAASKTGGGILSAGRKIGEGIGDIPGEGLSAKNIAKGIDTTTNKLTNVVEEYARTGKITANLGGILTDFGSFVHNEMTEAFSNVTKKATEISQEFPIINALNKAVQVAAGVIPPSNSNIPRGNVSTNSAGGSQTGQRNSTVDVNLNHTINITAPTGVDTKSLQDALNNPDVKQQIITTVKNSIYDANFGPIIKKNEPMLRSTP